MLVAKAALVDIRGLVGAATKVATESKTKETEAIEAMRKAIAAREVLGQGWRRMGLCFAKGVYTFNCFLRNSWSSFASKNIETVMDIRDNMRQVVFFLLFSE